MAHQGIEHIVDPTINDEIAQAVKCAAYAHDAGITHILVAGTSAQLGAFALRRAWHKLYPTAPVPRFVTTGKIFINEHSERFTPQIGEHTQYLLRRILAERLSKVSRSAKVLVFDEFASSLDTVRRMRNILGELGFHGIRTAIPIAHSDVMRNGFIANEIDFCGAITPQYKLKSHGYRRDKIRSILTYRRLRTLDTTSAVKRQSKEIAQKRRQELVKHRTAVREFIK